MSAQTLSDRNAGRRDTGLMAAWLIALISGGLFGTLAVLQHLAYNTHAFDLGLQHHVVWNTYKGEWFRYTYMVGFNPLLTNHLGDHVQLILLPISWLYFIYDGPETLLVIQAVVVASGIVPLFLLGRHWVGYDGPALLLACLYALHPGIQAAVLFDFHPITLAGALLLWAYYFFATQRNISGWLATLLFISCKENLALTVVLFGVHWLLRRRQRLGLGLVVLGTVWFGLCFFVILPHFNPGVGSNAFSRYRYLGDSWASVLTRLVREPQLLWQRLRDPVSVAYLKSLWMPFGLLSLLSPLTLAISASELGLNLLSSFDAQRTIDYQYGVVIIAVSALAAVRSVGWFSGLIRTNGKRQLAVAGACVAAACAVMASIGSQVAAYGGLRMLSPSYLDRFVRTPHDALGLRLLTLIPERAPVSAQSDLAPHVSSRSKVYVFPTVADAEYVLLDAKSTIFPVHLFPIDGLSPEEAYLEYIRRLLIEDSYILADEVDGWMLLVKDRQQTGADQAEVARLLSGVAKQLGMTD